MSSKDSSQGSVDLQAMTLERDLLKVLLKAKIEDAAKPVLVLTGNLRRRDVQAMVQMLRDVDSDAIVVVLASGNDLVCLDDEDLKTIGLMRIGIGS